MITKLLNLQFARLKKQKLLYLYFVVITAVVISNGLQCTGSPDDYGMGYYAGGRFPTMCMQSYIDIIGPLFLSFISAILICGERANGMFLQPLLNGASKGQLLIAKTGSILAVAFLYFSYVIIVSMGVGFLLWGSRVFHHGQEYLLQMLLLAFPQITLVSFFVLLSLYMSNISSMMCASLIILLVNNLFSQFFGACILYVDFMYYLYAFSEYNSVTLTHSIIVSGITVNIITEMVLVYSISRRAKNMRM